MKTFLICCRKSGENFYTPVASPITITDVKLVEKYADDFKRIFPEHSDLEFCIVELPNVDKK